MTLERRALGSSGLLVSVVGLGAGPLGDPRLDESDVRVLVSAALEHGVTLFDTAPSYGASEERLGRALAMHRDDVVIATKGGYGVPGVPDWTGEVIRLGIDAALGRLRTDRIDVFLLHSCDAHTLAREDIVEQLRRAKEVGKIRAIGYSGESEALDAAIASGHFDVVECSVNPFDRRSLDGAVREAGRRGLGVLAKRPLANAAWRHDTPPGAPDVREYWDRARVMGLDPAPLGWPEAALRFAAHAPGVTAALVGTSKVAHLVDAIASARRGPLDDQLAVRFEEGWREHARPEWRGVI